jgi:DNA-binding MarR family transcriptional regulator
MSASANVDKDYKLWILLHQAKEYVLKVRVNELKKIGLSVPEAGTLYVTKAIEKTEGKATPSKIAKGMLRQHHTVTALLKRMEKKGLITRNTDLDNRSTLIIRLTEKGEKALKQSYTRDSLHSVMSTLSEDEKERLEEYLLKIRDNAIKGALDVPIIPY